MKKITRCAAGILTLALIAGVGGSGHAQEPHYGQQHSYDAPRYWGNEGPAYPAGTPLPAGVSTVRMVASDRFGRDIPVDVVVALPAPRYGEFTKLPPPLVVTGQKLPVYQDAYGRITQQPQYVPVPGGYAQTAPVGYGRSVTYPYQPQVNGYPTAYERPTLFSRFGLFANGAPTADDRNRDGGR